MDPAVRSHCCAMQCLQNTVMAANLAGMPHLERELPQRVHAGILAVQGHHAAEQHAHTRQHSLPCCPQQRPHVRCAMISCMVA